VRHLDVSAEERMAYLKRANAVRRGLSDEAEAVVEAEESAEATTEIELGEERYVQMSEAEQLILTVSERGYGKRSSSYEYRITNRGGKGLVAMAIWEGKKGSETIKEKIGQLVASFPVEESDQLMLVTDAGKLIRTRVDGIRIAGRATQGVIVFNTADDEKVVSVERIGEEGEENGGGGG
jgi:DNA gyrase subunit A